MVKAREESHSRRDKTNYAKKINLYSWRNIRLKNLIQNLVCGPQLPIRNGIKESLLLVTVLRKAYFQDRIDCRKNYIRNRAHTYRSPAIAEECFMHLMLVDYAIFIFSWPNSQLSIRGITCNRTSLRKELQLSTAGPMFQKASFIHIFNIIPVPISLG